MSRTIQIPYFNYAAYYYPQLLEALIQFKRQNVPELTDESDFEPFIQLLRAFACVGHLNNTLLDMVANENTLPTASLTETVRDMLRLIDYELSSATPANVDLVYELSKPFSASFELISEDAQAATRSQTDVEPVPFECLTAVTISRTDQLTAVYRESSAGAFTDHTTAANAGTNWTPDIDAAGDKLYFGHDSVMWNELDFDVDTAMANINGIWEFYDGDWDDIQPDSVTDGGFTLTFDLTGLLGTTNKSGATVRVRYHDTGAYEDVVSTWTGTANIATTGLLGQTTPSTDIDDYVVGTQWKELAEAGISFVDNTSDLTVDGVLEYTLPQTELLDWQKTSVNGTTAYWIRWRTISATGATNPTLKRVRIDTGKQYALANATQGRSVEDDPLGSSTGDANQRFETTRDYFIDSEDYTELTVDSEVWTRVDNFLSSTSQNKHYRIELGENDRATIVFGDGNNGAIPPVGQGNISLSYRVEANNDGNVGANTVVVDKTGLTYVNSIWNPRQSTGWKEAEGATEESLEQAKIAGPASLRTKEVALSPSDAVTLTKSFVASDGSRPFSRATYVEEGFGAKTLKLIVVGSGGGQPTSSQLAELDEYFNGDLYSTPVKEKHFLTNNEVTSVAYTPKTIDITAVVTAPDTVTATAIRNKLLQTIQPEALKSDGVTYEWSFGGTVSLRRLYHEIFDADEDIEDVTISYPSSDVSLNQDELPKAVNINITVQQA